MTQYTRMSWQGGRLWGNRGKRAASNGLREALEHTLQVSRTQVPLEEGTLERSGKVDVDGLSGSISYDTVYAVIQHEALDFHHPMPGRKAKYLEDPMNSEQRKMLDLMRVSLRRWMRG